MLFLGRPPDPHRKLCAFGIHNIDLWYKTDPLIHEMNPTVRLAGYSPNATLPLCTRAKLNQPQYFAQLQYCYSLVMYNQQYNYNQCCSIESWAVILLICALIGCAFLNNSGCDLKVQLSGLFCLMKMGISALNIKCER